MGSGSTSNESEIHVSARSSLAGMGGHQNAPLTFAGVARMSYPTFSFQLFHPRTPESAAKLPHVMGQLSAVRPDYFSVTHGSGLSEQDGTYDTLMTVAEHS